MDPDDETAGDGLDFGEEKRRDLAKGYADELLEAVNWPIAEGQVQAFTGEQEWGVDGEVES